jgi:uncharacterized membrane protein
MTSPAVFIALMHTLAVCRSCDAFAIEMSFFTVDLLIGVTISVDYSALDSG